jgi:fluoroquinolone transport system ATP-binding protein
VSDFPSCPLLLGSWGEPLRPPYRTAQAPREPITIVVYAPAGRARREGIVEIVSVERLGYRYPGADGPVLRELDFEIAEGEVFGFLGPNGSGKSTTQKILTRILHGYEGAVSVFGADLDAQGVAYHEQIGVCFEIPNLYEKLSARENLDFYRRFYGGGCDAPDALLEQLHLPAGDKRPVGQYSKGMKMRVVLARSLVNRPRLWFLDEPTSGQDPEHAVRIRDLVRARADAGVSVFLTTHDMHLADSLCDRVAFLVDGRIARVGSPRELKLAHARRTVRVELRRGDALEAMSFELDDPASKGAFLELLARERVETIHTQEPSLEDVFLQVTGRTLLA